MEDEKTIPISYISQYYYCKRRAGLLMLEQQWNDSADTTKGTIEHRNVHSAGDVYKNGVHILTELQVFSEKLNLFGKCDVVEATEDENGVEIKFLDGKKCLLYPVEYKHGKLRTEEEYELQLCAQAMCMEEMFSCNIKKGGIFFISSHRRKEVEFTDELRNKVIEISKNLTEMMNVKIVPSAVSSSKCVKCSIKDICLPDIVSSIDLYMKQIHNNTKKEE